MKKLIIFLLACIGGSAIAQEKYFYINYDVNKPISNTSWISNTSSRGLRGGYRTFINERFSAGVDISWAVYDQYVPSETYVTGNTAITTDYFRYIYSYSAAASGQYNFLVGDGDKIFPYAGLGLGANNNQYVLYYNAYTKSERAWGFLARPEAGILVKFGSRRSVGAMAAVHYDYSTNQSKMFNYSGFSAVGFQIGLMFMEW
jgi:hypothetical protein